VTRLNLHRLRRVRRMALLVEVLVLVLAAYYLY
jgi:hypothetical protein